MVSTNHQLAGALTGVTTALVSNYDATEQLFDLVEHSVHLLDVDDAGLLLVDQRGGLQVVASSGEQARLLELLELQSDSGPCMDCYREGEAVHAPDLRECVQRWPEFVPTALARGYSSVHAVPLTFRGEVLGALNLFGKQPGPLPPASLRIARALADAATITIVYDNAAVQRELVIAQLEGALTSRIVIEQAKGMLAAAGALEMDQAFNRLRSFARRSQTGLTQVARDLTQGNLTPDVLLGEAGSSGLSGDRGERPAD